MSESDGFEDIHQAFRAQLSEIINRPTDVEQELRPMIELEQELRPMIDAAKLARQQVRDLEEDGRLGAELQTYEREALALAYRELDETFDAEDAVQEATLRCWLYRDRFDALKGSRKSWFFKTVKRCCLDIRARRDGMTPYRWSEAQDDRPRLVSLDALDREPALEELDPRERALVRKVICSLPPRQQQAVTLCLMGYDRYRAASRMRVRVKTVDELLRRARETMRRKSLEEAANG